MFQNLFKKDYSKIYLFIYLEKVNKKTIVETIFKIY